MESRVKKINKLLSEYSLGKFDKRIKLSPRLDALDGIANGINMLGDELKAITISKNYFTKIFNSVSDMVFVLDNKGQITDCNDAVHRQLHIAGDKLKGKHFISLVKMSNRADTKIEDWLSGAFRISKEPVLLCGSGVQIPTRITVSHFKDEFKKKRILLTASDITYQVKTENLVIRAIIDTQEQERNRFAADLHDSLSQQLSAIKFYISTIAEATQEYDHKQMLINSNTALGDVIADVRNICFSLMPKTLEAFGLVKAVQEFCQHFLFAKAAFSIVDRDLLPPLSRELSIDLYRVIQEFINNSVRHGNADKINIAFRYVRKSLVVELRDNGGGFNYAAASKGMGLQNVQSRVKSHNGTCIIDSRQKRGTSFLITIPINILP